MPDSRHITLTANTVATVTLDSDYDWIEVVNRDGAGEVFFTLDGTNPTVAGNGTLVLPATIGGVEIEYNRTTTAVIKLISAGTPKVSVRGW